MGSAASALSLCRNRFLGGELISRQCSWKVYHYVATSPGPLRDCASCCEPPENLKGVTFISCWSDLTVHLELGFSCVCVLSRRRVSCDHFLFSAYNTAPRPTTSLKDEYGLRNQQGQPLGMKGEIAEAYAEPATDVSGAGMLTAPRMFKVG